MITDPGSGIRSAFAATPLRRDSLRIADARRLDSRISDSGLVISDQGFKSKSPTTGAWSLVPVSRSTRQLRTRSKSRWLASR